MVEQFSNLVYEQSDSLEPAAKKVGLPIQTIKRIQRRGPVEKLSPELQRVFAHPKLLAALFSSDALVNKRNTEAIEIAPGVLVAARVLAHRPAATVPLDGVKSQVERLLRTRKAAEKASALADEAAKEFSASKALPVAIGSPRTLARADQQKGSGDIPAEVVQAIFAADAKGLPAVVSVPASERSAAAWMAVIESTVVPASDAVTVKEVLSRELQRLEQSAAADTLDRWVAMKRDAIGVKTFTDKLAKTER